MSETYKEKTFTKLLPNKKYFELNEALNQEIFNLKDIKLKDLQYKIK